MSKNPSKKKTAGTRNSDRSNGKAWSKKKPLDEKGRPLTGRGKPTGRSVKGMRVVSA